MKSLLERIRNNGLLLELVNGELKLFGNGTPIEPTLLSEIRERKKELVDFLKDNGQHTAVTAPAGIPVVPVQPDYALSPSQRRLWVMSQFEEANIAYNMPAVYVFDGHLNPDALTFAFNTLIERHESLRTVFRENAAGEVRQVIRSLADIGFTIGFTDLRTHTDPAAAARMLVGEELLRPFDLAQGPMVRAGVLQVADHQWIFTYAMHHIVSDGWSMAVLISELMLLYNTYGNGLPNPLTPLRIQYKDYAAWQDTQLSGAALEAHRNYWLGQFSGELPLLGFPADYPRPALKSYNGGVIHHGINATLTNGIKALCQEEGSTLFMGLLAAVNAVLYRYTGQTDIITGTQIAGREHADLDNQIGFYLNTLALRTRFSGTDAFVTLLTNVKTLTLAAYAHQAFPFDELVNALPIERDMSRTPLFDVSVVLHNTDAISGSAAAGGPDGLHISPYESQDTRSGLYELAFDFREAGDGIHCMVVYNSDVYAEDSIRRLVVNFEKLLAAAIEAPQTPVAQLSLLSEDDKIQLLRHFNPAAQIGYPDAASIISLFDEQAAATPEAMALVFEDVRLSYRQLQEKSMALAAYLLANHDIQTGDTVGILLDRSAQLIIAILGILRSGAAYVPVDTAYPRARKAFMVEDTAIKALVTSTDYMFEADYYTGPLIAIDVQLDDMAYPAAPLPVVVQPHDLAYIMYTSGTTGKPKGVMVEHRNVVRLVHPGQYAGITGAETILSTGAVSFDATTFEYWASLLRGGTLVLCSKETLLDTQRLAAAISSFGIDTMWFTAGWLNELIDKDISIFSGLKTILAGGDKLSVVHIAALRQHYPGLRIINGYGPTENTTFSVTFTIGDVPANLPIGKPIDNSTAYILSTDHQLQPIGVTGEIAVGGAGLSRGYLNEPGLTAEKFIPHPFLPGERLYLTGDLGRWMPDGNIAFIGRRDTQVKVRGYRIELGEIETALQQYAGISAAAVTARAIAGSEEKELVAYIVSTEPQSNTSLNQFLGGLLPAYMLPAYYVQLDALPLNANGKVDKKQLPDPAAAGIATGVPYIAPRNPTEEKLTAIWQEILGHGTISIKDDFFNLGGHSLKATRLASQIHKTFDVRVDLKDLFSRTILEEQAALIDAAGKDEFEAIAPIAVQESYPLSSSQRRLWVLSQFEEANTAYNMPAAYIFRGVCNKAALEQAFGCLMERHESLRTVFRENEEGAVRQVIRSVMDTGFAIQYEALQDLPAAIREVRVKELVQQSFTTPFNLATGPLIRAGLYQVAADEWVFTYTMHHIISDGWSMGLLIKELLGYYNACNAGTTNLLPPLRIQYKDYAAWQQQQLSGAGPDAHKAWWLQQFEGDLPILDLPADYPRPLVKTYNGNAIGHHITGDTATVLKALVQEQGGTLFMGLLAAVNVLLYRYSNQSDIIVGSPVAGRPHSDLHDQIGFYINTLALRTRFSGSDSFRQLFDRVKEFTLGAYEHQVFPFDELVDHLPLQRDMSRSALFDVMVILQNNELQEQGEALTIDGLTVGAYGGGESPVSKFDLMFSFAEAGGGIDMAIEYNTDLYARESVVRMIAHFDALLQGLISQPDRAVGLTDYLGAEERKLIVEGFNDNALAFDRSLTLTAYVEAQVAAAPEAIALSAGDRHLTYQSLNEQANQLAHYLKEQYDIKTGELVSVLLHRDEWLVIALLGVLKSGAAYVPVDPAYPQERIDYLLADSQSKLRIDEAWIQAFRSKQQTYPLSNPLPQHQPGDIAYIIYTSGSTGQPKGVMIEHRNVSAFLQWCFRQFDLSSFDVVFGVTSVCFDISIFELFYTLSTGKRIRLLENALFIPEYLASEQRVLLNTVPSVVGNLIREQQDFSNVVIMNLAGEPIPEQYTEQLDTGRMMVLNLYGPSEDTTYSTYFQLQKGQPIRVGKPINNSQVYILNDFDQVQPVGVIGEIVIAGDGISRGYLHRSELTAEKYVPHPWIPGQRIYRTGDLGRWMPDGNIDCIGRKDAQVKVRGYRIEPGEIETCLLQYDGIEEAIVVVRTLADGDKELVAYIVSAGACNSAELREYISRRLPVFMVPGYFVALEALPLTPNGKVDRKKLPDPTGAGMASGIMYIAPGNPIEEKLVDIWQVILGRSPIGIRDNFFALGGHSLKATQLAARIHQAFNVRIGLKELFTATVLEDQARLIAAGSKDSFIAIEPVAQQPDYAMSSAQRRLWVLGQFEEGSIAYNMPAVYVFDGHLNFTVLEQAFNALIARHEILRTVFRENGMGDIRQFILPPAEARFRISYNDYSTSDSNVLLVKNAVQQEINSPFDLAEGPLLRASLYRLTNDECVFAYTMHHIISDGWSMEILMSELLQYYHAFSGNAPDPLPALRIQYKDYAAWQQAQLAGDGVDAHKTWWLEQFAGELPILDLPGDKPRPVVKTYNGAVLGRTLSPEAATGIRQFSQEQGCTSFMGVLALVNVLLHRYTSQEDIIVGSPIAGRPHSDLHDQIGFYVNTLALRSRISGHDSFKELLTRTRQLTLDAYDHQVFPFDELVDSLSLRHDTSRTPLFDVMVVLQNSTTTTTSAPVQPGSFGIRPYAESTHSISKFDLTFFFEEQEDTMLLRVEYNTDIYHADSIGKMMLHLSNLLGAALLNPDSPINQLPMLGEAEQQQLLHGFNATAVTYPGNKTVVSLFEEQVLLHPGAPAIVVNGALALTYMELNEQANRFAACLRQQYNIQHGDLVGVEMDRGVKFLVAIFGVLKCGAAYLPIDPNYPMERIEYLVADSRCKQVITEASFDLFVAEQVQYPVNNPPGITRPEDVVYVIYTSGSTGMPKGTQLENHSLVNLCHWYINHYELKHPDRSTLFASVSFDASIIEIFPCLLSGGILYIVPEEIRTDANALAAFYTTHQMTTCFLPTQMGEKFMALEPHPGSKLRWLIVGGDKLNTYIPRGYRVSNNYGPTENTVMATAFTVDGDYPNIPIGKPIANNRVYILNEALQPQPAGITGEIAIAGDSLARGYLHREALTAEKFVTLPLLPGERIYRTGDLGRWLPDGNIEFLGRRDTQVKIRGFRIETGEIEALLRQYPGIEAAVVVAYTGANGEKELAAYIVSADTLHTADLRTHLGRSLPAYMIPAYFVQLSRLPVNANGKVDKSKLPDPSGQTMDTGTAYVAPRNETEEKLTGIWQQVLGRDRVGVEDNFFDLGGNSIRIVKMVGLVNAAFAIKLPVVTAFKFPNISALAEHIHADDPSVTTVASDADMQADASVMDETFNVLNNLNNEA